MLEVINSMVIRNGHFSRSHILGDCARNLNTVKINEVNVFNSKWLNFYAYSYDIAFLLRYLLYQE